MSTARRSNLESSAKTRQVNAKRIGTEPFPGAHLQARAVEQTPGALRIELEWLRVREYAQCSGHTGPSATDPRLLMPSRTSACSIERFVDRAANLDPS